MSLLFSPLQIGALALPGRLVMPPMAVAKAGADGTVTPALCDYYAEKARGGHLGLVITEHSYVNRQGQASKGQLALAQDGDVAGLRLLVETVHRQGCKIMAQISHAGAAAKPAVTGCTPVAPSALPLPQGALVAPRDAVVPQELSLEEIRAIIADFAAAAVRAKAAGYDGVELHSAHGYLLNQFYSPLTNRRTDAYRGDTLAGRIRLHLEILEAVRGAVGPDYPLALRLGACDYRPGGTTGQDSVQAAREFEQAGVDLLDISGGLCGYSIPGSGGQPQGYFSELSAAIRAAVKVPVLLTGGITEPQAAEDLLQQGKADLVGVGRALLRQSDWPAQAAKALG